MNARPARHPRELYVTPLDIDLLAAVQSTRSIVDACARLAITRDLGMYRLRRLTRALGSPVVVSRRGGATRGRTLLTALGRRMLERGVGPLHGRSDWPGVASPTSNVIHGVWHSGPPAHITVGGDGVLFVTFAAREGEAVRVGIEAEALVIARRRFRSSARNVLAGGVESVQRLDGMRAVVRVRIGGRLRLRVAVTPTSLVELGLSPGARVFVYLKATAIRRLAY